MNQKVRNISIVLLTVVGLLGLEALLLRAFSHEDLKIKIPSLVEMSHNEPISSVVLFPFLLFFQGNCGSSVLMDMLRWHPQAMVIGFEPLEQRHQMQLMKMGKEYSLNWVKNALVPPGDESGYSEWLSHVLSNPNMDKSHESYLKSKLGHIKTVGLKVRPKVLSRFEIQENIFTWMNNLWRNSPTISPRVIILRRKNLLKHAISTYRRLVESKDQFHPTSEGIPHNPSNVTFQDLLPYMERVLMHDSYIMDTAEDIVSRFLDSSNKSDELMRYPIRQLFYEDLLYKTNKTITAMLSFLGLDSSDEIVERMSKFVKPSRNATSSIKLATFNKATHDDLCLAVDDWKTLCKEIEESTLKRPFMKFCFCGPG